MRGSDAQGEVAVPPPPGLPGGLEPHPRRVRVALGGAVIADSERALRVLETGHAPVVYFPREDVRMDLLERTDAETFCPFEGEASCWTVRARDRLEENAVWSCEDPFEPVVGLTNYASSYTDRLSLEEV